MKGKIFYFSIVLLIFLLRSAINAQNTQPVRQANLPLEKILKSDGTLDTDHGYKGSLDPKGWRLIQGKNGAPKFIRNERFFRESISSTSESVVNWDTRFGFPGPDVNGNVTAIAVSGSDVYVGGAFTQAGGFTVNYIAKWDGSAWSSLGSGMYGYMHGYVYAIAPDGSDVYVGGNFYQAGDVVASNIAKWDGSAWSSLGDGVDGIVTAIAVNGSDVYVGGAFTQAGGFTVNHIAKWDGCTWSSLGDGVDEIVTAIAVNGSDVYVGGAFTQAGGFTVNYIAKWDGSTWSPLGNGVGGAVSAIAANGSNVYVGGKFTQAGGVASNNIAKWNGSSWSPLGNGVGGPVNAIAVNGLDVYAGGVFTWAGSVIAKNIAKWDGSAWSSLGSGMNGGVQTIALSGSDLCVGGNFTQVDGMVANYLAKWKGSNWSSMNHEYLGNGLNGDVNALAVNESNVYVGGVFTQAGGVASNYIAKWDGSAWSPLGSGLNGNVYAIAVNGSNVYVGGVFTQAGGVASNYITKWDGSAWSSLGSGVNGRVNAITVGGSDVYVVGSFTQAGGFSVNNIAKWDGSTWFSLGGGVNYWSISIAVSGSDVYVGGTFSEAGGVVANNIAKWDGTAWYSLGKGVNNFVHAIAVSGGDVYVGGKFIVASGKSSNYIARCYKPNLIDLSQVTASLVGINPLTIEVKGDIEDVEVGDFSGCLYFNDDNTTNLSKWDNSLFYRWGWDDMMARGAFGIEEGSWTKAGRTYAKRFYFSTDGYIKFEGKHYWRSDGTRAIICDFDIIGNGHAYLEMGLLTDESGNPYNINYINREISFSDYSPSYKFIKSMAISPSDGLIWACTSDGLACYNGSTWCLLDEEIDPANPALNKNIASMTVDEAGALWVVASGSVYKYKAGESWSKHGSTDGFSLTNASCIEINEKTGYIVVGATNGIGIYNGSNWSIHNYPADCQLPGIRNIEFDNTGDTWIVTLDGLAKFDGSNWTTYPKTGSPMLSFEYGILELRLVLDEYGNKWISNWYTNNIQKYSGSLWSEVTMPDIYPRPYTENEGFAITELNGDKNGNLYTGTDGVGIIKYDYLLEKWDTDFSSSISGLGDGYGKKITSIVFDHSQTGWLGTWGDGLKNFQFDGSLFSGKVSDGLLYIKDAIVEIWDHYPNGNILASDTTDNNGQFLRVLDKGTYDVRVIKSQYYPKLLTKVTGINSDDVIILEKIPTTFSTNRNCDFWGQSCLFMGSPIKKGDVVTAKNKNGVVCGISDYSLTQNGGYLMHVIGDDQTTVRDEGATDQDVIRFFINGYPAKVTAGDPVWEDRGSKNAELQANRNKQNCLSLQPGWNLVGLNVNLTDNSIGSFTSNFHDSTVNYIMSYHKTGPKTWDRMRPPFLNDLKNISGSYGYWINNKARQCCTFEGEGAPVPVDTLIRMETDWNLIGYLPDSEDGIGHSFSTLGENYTYVFGYESGIGPKTWDRRRPEILNDLKTLMPLHGYWVKMTRSDTLIFPTVGYSAQSLLAKTRNSGQSPSLSGFGGITPYLCDFWGYGDSRVRTGATVDVMAFSGKLCGSGSVVPGGGFLVHVAGDDPGTADVEGAKENESLTILINGVEMKTGNPLVYNERESKEVEFYSNDRTEKPFKFSLSQNYPNPFNPETTIPFELAKSENVLIKIYDLNGRIVRTLEDRRFDAGSYKVRWDGLDDFGRQIASGVYVIRIQAGAFVKQRKMVLMR